MNITIIVGRREAVLWVALVICLGIILWQAWPTQQNVLSVSPAVVDRTPQAIPAGVPQNAPITRSISNSAPEPKSLVESELTFAERSQICNAASIAYAALSKVVEEIPSTLAVCRDNRSLCRSRMTPESWNTIVKPICMAREPMMRASISSSATCDSNVAEVLALAEEGVGELGALTGRRIEDGCL